MRPSDKIVPPRPSSIPSGDSERIITRAELRAEQWIGFAALALLLIGCFVVVRPFLTAILWAVILAYSTWPVFVRIQRATGGRTTLAALITTLLLVAVLVVPLSLVGASLADNVRHVVENLRAAMQEELPELPRWVVGLPVIGAMLDNWRAEFMADRGRLIQDLAPYLGNMRDWLIASGASLGQGLLELSLSILVTFFIYRDGKNAGERLEAGVQRLAGTRAQRLLAVAETTTKGVVYGIVGTAIIQALLATVGFLIAGVEAAFFLGFVTFLLALLPMGPPLIWGPVAAWLIFKGDTGWGIFLALWGLFAVSSVDNVLRPYLIGRESELPFILIFFGVLGGVMAFGFLGIFLGPTLLALGYTLVHEWSATSK